MALLLRQSLRTRFFHLRALLSTKVHETKSEKEVSNEPIHFIGSQAARWKAHSSRSGGSDETLWYQPYVISGSLAVFILYFGMLREENDIDEKLEGSLYEHVEGLEEVQLMVTYTHNKKNGFDTTAIEQRLRELGVDVEKL